LWRCVRSLFGSRPVGRPRQRNRDHRRARRASRTPRRRPRRSCMRPMRVRPIRLPRRGLTSPEDRSARSRHPAFFTQARVIPIVERPSSRKGSPGELSSRPAALSTPSVFGRKERTRQVMETSVWSAPIGDVLAAARFCRHQGSRRSRLNQTFLAPRQNRRSTCSSSVA
jgi:hypothetical protein